MPSPVDRRGDRVPRCLSNLKKVGEIGNPTTGSWEITDAGRQRLELESSRWSIEPFQGRERRRNGRCGAGMTVIGVDEGVPFALTDGDRLFVLERLGGFAEAQIGGVRIARIVGHLRLPSGATLSIRSPKAPAASILSCIAYSDRTSRSVSWNEHEAAGRSFAARVREIAETMLAAA